MTCLDNHTRHVLLSKISLLFLSLFLLFPSGCNSDISDEIAVNSSQINNNSLLTDSDADGISDDVEYSLARALKPKLIMSSQEDDSDLFFPTLGHAIPFRVTNRTLSSSHPDKLCTQGKVCIEIVYGLAYIRDNGVTALQISGHVGDSEAVVIYAMADNSDRNAWKDMQRWRVKYAWMSAHSGELSDSSTLSRFSDATSPTIWVSARKHANYPTEATCNNGGCLGPACFDYCSNTETIYEALDNHLINVGEPEKHLEANIFNPTSETIDYSVWAEKKFGGASAYTAIFNCIGKWHEALSNVTLTWNSTRSTDKNEAIGTLATASGTVRKLGCH